MSEPGMGARELHGLPADEVHFSGGYVPQEGDYSLGHGMYVRPDPDRAARLAAAKIAEATFATNLRLHLNALAYPPESLTARIIQLHAQGLDDGELVCRGCDPGAHAEDFPDWPCTTTLLIAYRTGFRPAAERLREDLR